MVPCLKKMFRYAKKNINVQILLLPKNSYVHIEDNSYLKINTRGIVVSFMLDVGWKKT